MTPEQSGMGDSVEPLMPSDDEKFRTPDGYRRTLANPIPVVQCTFRWSPSSERHGEQCARWSVRGTTRCTTHGGRVKTVAKHAEAMVEAARLRLVDAAPQAAEWIVDLAANAGSEAVRLNAAKEVLDRAGVRGGSEIDVRVTADRSPADVLRERLEQLRSRHEAAAAAEANVIDGEVVNDPDEDDTVPGNQLELFSEEP